MGIYDREYIKEGRSGGGGFSGRAARGPGGLGRLRMLSVTAWLIVANCLVMLAQMGLTNLGTPVRIATQYFGQHNAANVQDPKELQQFFVPLNTDALVPVFTPVPEAATRQQRNVIARPLFDGVPGPGAAPVGQVLYKVMDPLEALGHFSTAKGFAELQVWRLVTFQFLHSGFLHLFFNMFGLYVFGPLVEQQLGGKRFLAFYLTCGIFGGLMYLVLNLVGFLGLPLPGALHTEIWTPLVGASAGVFGVLMACAYIAPKALVRLLFPPVSLEMRWVVYGYFAIALWNLISEGKNQGGDAAHVGGALAGFYFIRRPWLLRDFFDVFKDSRKIPDPGLARPSQPDLEIDRILDKISQSGMQSLSDRERKALEAHSRRGKP